MLNLFQDKLVFYSKSVVVLMGSEGKGSQELISPKEACENVTDETNLTAGPGGTVFAACFFYFLAEVLLSCHQYLKSSLCFRQYISGSFKTSYINCDAKG